MFVPLLFVILKSHASDTCNAPEYCNCTNLSEGGYHVDCRGMGLTTIPNNLPPTTRILDISQNSISRITRRDLERTIEIISLNVSYNRIAYISHHCFDKMSKLKILDLSSNNISDVFGVFEHTYELETLILSSNNIKDLATSGDENPFKEMTHMRSLDVSNNSIEFFPKIQFSQTAELNELYLSKNRISDIRINSSNVPYLRSLDISYNQCTNITNKTRTEFDILGIQLELTLAGNPLLCQCDTLDFVKWLLYTDVQIITYENDTFCMYHSKIEDFNRLPYLTKTLKRECTITHDYVPLIIGCCVVLVLVTAVISGAIVYNYRWKFRYLYHLTISKYSGYIEQRNKCDHVQYLFDFNISYCEEDQWFVSQHLVGNLETKRGMKLCIHERDFIAGKPIEANIINAVQTSKRTLIILSRNYIEDQWCIFYFNMARMNDIYDGRDSLVILELDILEHDIIPREILEVMAVEPCISFPASGQPDDRFWGRLLSVFRC